MWFPAVENVAAELVRRINAETVRIDISIWYLTERSVTLAIANRFAAGVPVRLVGDRGAIFEIDPKTKAEFYYLANKGVPIRLRFNPTWFPEIDHMKMAIFVGQNVVEFGSANWDTFSIIPFSSTNYNDETAFFTNDPALVSAFKTRFDRLWNDTTPEPQSIYGAPPYLKDWNDACAHEPMGCDFLSVYPTPAPMVINTARLEPDNPTPVDLIWGQGRDFNNRLITEINNENTSIYFANYRLTVDNVTDALLNKQRSGVPVQLLIEPDEYLNKKWPEFWLTHANYDKLWAAGVQIKQRNHAGNMHMKTLITSTFATNASSNISAAWERDHDHFVSAAAKPSIYAALKNRVLTMWNDTSGFVPFQPGPPDPAVQSTPGQGAAQVPTDVSLVWNAAAFATDYDIFMGFSASAQTRLANVKAQMVKNPPSQYSWTPPAALCSGTTYYWSILSRTNATPVNSSVSARSSTHVFTTAGPNQGCSALPGGGGTTGGSGGTWRGGGTGGRGKTTTDFDGDGRSDIAVYRPSTGQWLGLFSTTNYTQWGALTWGMPGDIPVPGDYDGDGRTDLAVYRPSTGEWLISYTSTGFSTWRAIQWGVSGDIPVPGDYDGDGKTDPAVYRPSTGYWLILKSSANYQFVTYQWGMTGDVPVPADYDGDGKTNPAVFRPATGSWLILHSNYQWTYFSWGIKGDVPMPADYDGDRRSDPAVYRPSNGHWYILKSSLDYQPVTYQWGIAGDVPVVGDYDGDHKMDIAVYRPSNGYWLIAKSSTGFGTWMYAPWGASGDKPLFMAR